MEDKIKKLIEEPLKKEKISIVDIYFEEEYGVSNLYILIDKKPYVDIDTCVEVTNIINPILDENEITEDSYILEIISKERGE